MLCVPPWHIRNRIRGNEQRSRVHCVLCRQLPALDRGNKLHRVCLGYFHDRGRVDCVEPVRELWRWGV